MSDYIPEAHESSLRWTPVAVEEHSFISWTATPHTSKVSILLLVDGEFVVKDAIDLSNC